MLLQQQLHTEEVAINAKIVVLLLSLSSGCKLLLLLSKSIQSRLVKDQESNLEHDTICNS